MQIELPLHGFSLFRIYGEFSRCTVCFDFIDHLRVGSFFSIALLGSGMSAATVLFYRMGVAALLIGLVAAAQRKSFVITAREFVIIVGLGWLYAGTSLGLILSYSLIPSGIATTIHFLYPILVTFLMIVFFREKRSAGLVVAAVVSLLGVGLLSWSGGAVVNVEGIMLVLITVITYALYIVGVNKTGVGRIDSLPLTFYILLSAAVLFAMFAGLTTGIGPDPQLVSGGECFADCAGSYGYLQFDADTGG